MQASEDVSRTLAVVLTRLVADWLMIVGHCLSVLVSPERQRPVRLWDIWCNEADCNA
jgi:hypothetical protein